MATTKEFVLDSSVTMAAYDAAYLELAVRRQLPLATLDTKLESLAAAVGLTILRV